MATYSEITDYIRTKHGYTAKTCWIAHVKSDHGLTMRMSPRRRDPNKRVHPCPDNKRLDIEQAFKYFGMIR